MANISKMMDEVAEEMGGKPLSIKADENVGYAETDGEVLFYNSAFMSRLETQSGEDGVRFVLAHEIGHQVGGMHHGGHDGEFMADEFASRALARMGADFSAIASVFSFLNSPGSETHPATASRSARARSVYHEEHEAAIADDVELGLESKRMNPNVRDLSL